MACFNALSAESFALCAATVPKTATETLHPSEQHRIAQHRTASHSIAQLHTVSVAVEHISMSTHWPHQPQRQRNRFVQKFFPDLKHYWIRHRKLLGCTQNVLDVKWGLVELGHAWNVHWKKSAYAIVTEGPCTGHQCGSRVQDGPRWSKSFAQQ